MAQVTGIVYVYVDGQQLQSKPGATLELGGKNRNAIMANGVVIGHAEEGVAGAVECTLAHTADTDLTALAAATDAVVVFQTDTGDAYSISGATLEAPPTLTGGEGDVSLRYTGRAAKRLSL